jgi:hypothetical protein
MNADVLKGIARHLLTSVGGVLVAKGVVDAGQLEVLAGAGAILVGIVWSYFKNK